ncbi:hypothetical protein ACFX2J_027352 [Malus domestica]
MTPREEHVSSPAQVPLATIAKSDDEQHMANHIHRNRDTNEQDMPKSNIGSAALPGAKSMKKSFTSVVTAEV